jgi:hypothetical protein
MYLHTGNGKTVRKKSIIGIFDMDTATVSSYTKVFLSAKQKKKALEYSDSDIPRSFVLYEKDKTYRVRLSRISTYGLKSRLDGEIEE